MDDQRKDPIDPKRPPWRNRSKQLQTHNVPIYDVENTIGTNKGGELLLVNKPRTLSQGTERMLQVDHRHKRAILHWSTHR